MREKNVAGDLPGGSDMIVNSVSALTVETWENRDGQYSVRVVKSGLVQVKVRSLTITQTTGDVAKDRQFGYDYKLTGNEWS